MSLFNRMSPPSNMQDAMKRLQEDPKGVIAQAGVNIPEGLMGNPESMVKHLIQTGQVGGPVLQKIMPLIQRMK